MRILTLLLVLAIPAPLLAGEPAPGPACTADLICAIKERVRFQRRPWDRPFCARVAKAVLAASGKYEIDPRLVLSVMLNESEFVADAMRVSTDKNGRLTAVDGGLMGARCVLGEKRRRGERLCVNGSTRGMTVHEIMEPEANIDLGVKRLAFWKNGGSKLNWKTVYWKGGRRQVRVQRVECPHTTHAWWAHYNHGTRYVSSGRWRHYPHRIAVLYNALVHATDQVLPAALHGPITVKDKRLPRRTIDQPVGRRHKRLVAQIRKSRDACAPAMAAGRSRVLTASR